MYRTDKLKLTKTKIFPGSSKNRDDGTQNQHLAPKFHKSNPIFEKSKT